MACSEGDGFVALQTRLLPTVHKRLINPLLGNSLLSPVVLAIQPCALSSLHLFLSIILRCYTLFVYLVYSYSQPVLWAYPVETLLACGIYEVSQFTPIN